MIRKRFQRRGSGLARPWRDLEYAVVDLETTGLDLENDEIVSYGVVIIRDGRIVVADNRYAPVCPTCTPSPASISVHTLRQVDLADAAPVSAAVDILGPLLADRILVAHASWIEQSFLTRVFAAHSVRLHSPIIDTAALARTHHLASSRDPGEPDLEWLAERLRLPVVNPHHALGDATTTAHVFLALASKLGEAGYTTCRDFVDLTNEDHAFRRSARRR